MFSDVVLTKWRKKFSTRFFHLFLQNNNHLLLKGKVDKKEFQSSFSASSDLQMDLRDKVSNYRTTDRGVVYF